MVAFTHTRLVWMCIPEDSLMTLSTLRRCLNRLRYQNSWYFDTGFSVANFLFDEGKIHGGDWDTSNDGKEIYSDNIESTAKSKESSSSILGSLSNQNELSRRFLSTLDNDQSELDDDAARSVLRLYRRRDQTFEEYEQYEELVQRCRQPPHWSLQTPRPSPPPLPPTLASSKAGSTSCCVLCWEFLLVSDLSLRVASQANLR